ncbi:Serine/threonine-protein phosphatase 2A activator 1 [Microbotryomycetes sp. JL221]|nr:Serine/threonine-protein phosphatase 2A activator 1 [Microbotryomycetes sp. JL221]
MQSNSTAPQLSEPLPPLPLYPRPSTSDDDNDDEAPTRKIYDERDVERWTRSEPFHWIQTIILRLSVAVDNKTVTDACHESSATKQIVSFLDQAATWIDDVPLQTGPQRFGNKAFRDWVDKLEHHDIQFHTHLLQQHDRLHACRELVHHFRSSFGSSQRLDYGTGHELSFLAYLLILRLLGILTPQDEQAMVTRIFVSYLQLVRKLQKKFNLEPAGSKGVWGLDDHQHLVYLWGASQLRAHPSLKPSAILAPSQISHMNQSYLFLSSILHVNELKRGPFAEHSPLLHNIATTVPSWSKVSTGLFKMYSEEVLKKLPVVQHFWFGKVLNWKEFVEGQEPFKGSTMESTGDKFSIEEKQQIDQVDNVRERDEGTVAPWALNQLTSQGILTGQISTKSNRSPTSSIRTTPTSSLVNVTMPHSQQQQQQTCSTIEPRSFSSPTLFPKRRSSSNLSPTSNDTFQTNSVASQGGAASTTSPFGVLPQAKLSNSRSTT